MQKKAFKRKTNYLAGLTAEQSIIADYTAHSHKILAHRWCGQIGKIDLILADRNTLIFNEVKKANPTQKPCRP